MKLIEDLDLIEIKQLMPIFFSVQQKWWLSVIMGSKTSMSRVYILDHNLVKSFTTSKIRF